MPEEWRWPQRLEQRPLDLIEISMLREERLQLLRRIEREGVVTHEADSRWRPAIGGGVLLSEAQTESPVTTAPCRSTSGNESVPSD